MLVIYIMCFFAIESLYCYLRKKQSHKEKKEISYDTKKLGKGYLVILSAVSFATDVTFLFSKIVGYIPSHFIRMMFYKYIFHMTIGKGSVICYGLEVRSPWNIVIGSKCNIGDRNIFDARYGIVFGDNINTSSGVWIWTEQHDINSPSFSTEGKKGKVVVGDRVWLSSRTTILPGAIIEEGDVVAAGAVLSKKNTEPFSVYGGVPAKKIAVRNSNLNYEFGGKHRLFL